MRALAWALLLAACSAPAAIPTSSPSPLAVVELKYRVFDEVGRPWYCDPDFYPVAREDEAVLAEQRLPEIQADAETYRAILSQNGLAGAPANAEQLLTVYRDWKQLRALDLQPVGDAYGFDVLVESTRGTKEGAHVQGRVDRGGRVSILRSDPAGPPNCPICLSAQTLIDGPSGPVRVTELRAGDLVWTLDARGRRVTARLLRAASVAAPPGHEVVHVTLADGRGVTASPGHPTADGRVIGSLGVGDQLDGSTVAAVRRLPYRGRTYDLLPAGSTSLYWADGIALASTLRVATLLPR